MSALWLGFVAVRSGRQLVARRYDQHADDLTEEGMCKGVKESRVFLLIVTKQIFKRPFCRREIHEARRLCKRIVIVQECDGRFAPWDYQSWVASDEFHAVPWEASAHIPHPMRASLLDGPYDSEDQNIDAWCAIRDIVSEQKDQLIPYRRRAYENEAMLQELLLRCAITEFVMYCVDTILLSFHSM